MVLYRSFFYLLIDVAIAKASVSMIYLYFQMFLHVYIFYIRFFFPWSPLFGLMVRFFRLRLCFYRLFIKQLCSCLSLFPYCAFVYPLHTGLAILLTASSFAQKSLFWRASAPFLNPIAFPFKWWRLPNGRVHFIMRFNDLFLFHACWLAWFFNWIIWPAVFHRPSAFLWFYLFGGKLLKDVAGFNPVFFSDHFYCYLC